MASLNTMVKKTAGLIDTRDVNEWENEFLQSIVEQTDEGEDTTSLTARQVEVLERIYRKHFAP